MAAARRQARLPGQRSEIELRNPPLMQVQPPLENRNVHLHSAGLKPPDGPKGTALEIWKTQTFAAVLGPTMSGFSPKHIFFNGWIIQPRNVELMMKMLPDFYLRQFQRS